MTIRPATEADISQIVALLKTGLGESLVPKSESYWRWKHIDNPFGPSPVLLAFDGEKLVGVRAFMRWEWKAGEKSVRAVRAVDTVTHPDYQGKGIFKKLTMSLLEACKEEGVDIVFNTPNDKSKPGYLKMGWVEAGKLPVNARIRKPVSIVLSLVRSGKRESADKQDTDINDLFNHPGLPALIAETKAFHPDVLTTSLSPEYLRWRYVDVPVGKYYAVSPDRQALNGLVIFRTKMTKAGREMRITDVFMNSTASASELNRLIKTHAQLHDADYITLSNFGVCNILKGGLSLANLRLGPSVTVRSISQTDLSSFLNFRQWHPSLGDLELF
jgi:N-acetylglutamate synthase-like GNAT family acetyltransferase